MLGAGVDIAVNLTLLARLTSFETIKAAIFLIAGRPELASVNLYASDPSIGIRTCGHGFALA